MSTHAPAHPSSPPRRGVDIRIGEGAAPVVSDTWRLGAWSLQFVRLGPDQAFGLPGEPGSVHVKVVTGRLAEPERGPYAAPRAVRTTRVDADHVRAGAEGALIAVFVAGPAATAPVTRIEQLRIEGPHADAFAWQTFEARYAGALAHFNGLDAHLAPGFRLLDADGSEIAHVFAWAAGPGVDMSTHNHGQAPSEARPAFAETHLVLHKGGASGGMYETEAPGSPARARTPMAQGDEHGPFFEVEPDSGRPRLHENGAVAYPWHSWEAAPAAEASGAYDVVAAFEITAPYARA